MAAREVDEQRLEAFLHTLMGDLGASVSMAVTYIGVQAGLFDAMAGAGPLTVAEVAKRAGARERYVREWLASQAAGGYIEYDAADDTFELSNEVAFVFADEESPVYLGGPALGANLAMWAVTERLAEAFKTGAGVPWGEHHPNLFTGTEAFFRPNYRANLTTSWVPALEGVEARLEAGARLADVGCGHAAATIILATAYPNSEFHGFDFHGPSIETARGRAEEAGVAARTTFETATAQDFPGHDFDLICFFDCLHDMGDPVGAVKHAREALADGGSVLLVEPFASDTLEGNLHPLGRMMYGASTLVCTPNSLSQDVGRALGAQAGEAELRGVFAEAGLNDFRRAAETPFNLVFQARK